MKLGGSISRHFSRILKSAPLVCGDQSIKERHAHCFRTHQSGDSNAMSKIIRHYALTEASMDKARFAFIDVERPTLPIWNHMIRGFFQSESPESALDMFDEMRGSGVLGDNLTFIFACKACGRLSDVLYGKRIHVHVLKLGFGSYLYVCNALIHMYGCCGDLRISREVFDEMSVKDLVSWNSLICGYSRCGDYKEVLDLFDAMKRGNVKGDEVTMVKVVLACSYLGEWKLVDSMVEYIEDNCVKISVFLCNTLIDVYGRRGSIAVARGFFDRMTERNDVSWNAMIIGAAKSGDLVAAKKLFDEMPEKDAISWTSMITAYAQANQFDDAIWHFHGMMAANIKPDKIAVTSVLSACGHLRRVDVGSAVHDFICKSGTNLDTFVENALIDMYCKCKSIDKALTVFHKMKEKDSISWTSVICGLAMSGDSDKSLDFFQQMLGDGIRPIHGTFIGVLQACIHAGLVEKGFECFCSMREDYGLVPEIRHYGCVVDLFCRAGNVPRAYEFIKHMPIVPDIVIWRILFYASKLHENFAIAKIAFGKLLELDPSNGTNCVL
ncbi:pentatricopeptide repeat-containing protein At2g22410, mitochondrial-like [Primulina huaijiensis]|uniref:pentatricopeptide repeat-containing protein At2g22410, mitochondrial-like n=1 Tax=Primulina huaijiensis TaxID=1492673 RepID=UPI003CC6FB6B